MIFSAFLAKEFSDLVGYSFVDKNKCKNI